jgi:hypothetical protein
LPHKRLALQIALQLPSDPEEAEIVLSYAREILRAIDNVEVPTTVKKRGGAGLALVASGGMRCGQAIPPLDLDISSPTLPPLPDISE